MSKPSNFDDGAYQSRINQLVGTRDGRPLIQLDWAPNRFRWMPHKLGDDPPGYTYPSFCNRRDENGELRSPERWGLWSRNEPEQYRMTWEAGRYAKDKRNGCVYDIKGPCPSEKYTELHLHAYHDTDCCPCEGYECACDDHCHGKYAEPNQDLFDWIRRVSFEAAHDPDVQPMQDARFFESPHAQREVVTAEQRVQESVAKEDEAIGREVRDYLRRHPITTSGLKQTPSGLYLIDN